MVDFVKNAKFVTILFAPLVKVAVFKNGGQAVLLDVSLEEAQQLLLQNLTLLDVEKVSILDASDRILAENLVVGENLPAWSSGARDGYVVHAKDLDGHRKLSIVDTLAAEQLPHALNSGEAVEVRTGETIPKGSAALVPHEEVEIGETEIYLGKAVRAGEFIRQAGEDFKVGELYAPEGSIISPGLISVLAAQGRSEVPVYRSPRVAILSLGEQLVSWKETPGPGCLRDSNGPLIAALARRDGAQIAALNVVGNKGRAELVTYMQDIIEEADLLITIGGTYARKEAQTRSLFTEMGGEMLFWGVPIQPGGHNGAALWNKKCLISLSGNPAACAVGYELLVAPVIRALQGKEPYTPRVTAQCLDNIGAKGSERRFVRSYLTTDGNIWRVKVLPGQKPGMIRSLLNCNALIDLPAGNPAIEAGALVTVILLDPNSIRLEQA
jgi:molybdopterin molybdotransferase